MEEEAWRAKAMAAAAAAAAGGGGGGPGAAPGVGPGERKVAGAPRSTADPAPPTACALPCPPSPAGGDAPSREQIQFQLSQLSLTDGGDAVADPDGRRSAGGGGGHGHGHGHGRHPSGRCSESSLSFGGGMGSWSPGRDGPASPHEGGRRQLQRQQQQPVHPFYLPPPQQQAGAAPQAWGGGEGRGSSLVWQGQGPGRQWPGAGNPLPPGAGHPLLPRGAPATTTTAQIAKVPSAGLIGDSLRMHDLRCSGGRGAAAAAGDSPATIVTGNRRGTGGDGRDFDSGGGGDRRGGDADSAAPYTRVNTPPDSLCGGGDRTRPPPTREGSSTLGPDLAAAPFPCSTCSTGTNTPQGIQPRSSPFGTSRSPSVRSPSAGNSVAGDGDGDGGGGSADVTPTSAGLSGKPPPMYLLPPSGMSGGMSGGDVIQLYAAAQPYGASVAASSSLAARPILYSAIGSLERNSLQNLGSFNLKLMASRAGAGAGAGAASKPLRQLQSGPSNTAGTTRDGDKSGEKADDHAAPATQPVLSKGPTPAASMGLAPKDGMPPPEGSEGPSAEEAASARGVGGGTAAAGKAAGRRRRSAGPKKERRASQTSDPAAAASDGAAVAGDAAPSPMRGRKKRGGGGGGRRQKKRVTIDTSKVTTSLVPPKERGGARGQEGPTEMFRPSCDAYTPRMDKRKTIEYRPAELRTPHVQKMATTMGTIQRPNFRDALRRVAMIIQQHVVKIERRFEGGVPGLDDTGLFLPKMRDAFSEANFVTPRYKCSMVRLPLARPGALYGLRRIKEDLSSVPTTADIYEFGHRLFKSVQLSSECSIVCLIYVERLMEIAKVPLMACTWRPIFMCGLLLASKVWQDLSSWNIEFASVYPQFSLDAINRLEAQFLKMVRWDLYISSSLYAKYYFALRSLLEKQDFRQRYNQMVGAVGSHVVGSDALKVQKRSERVKEEALLQLSRSM